MIWPLSSKHPINSQRWLPGQGLQGSRAGRTQRPVPGGPSEGKKVICQVDGGYDVRGNRHGRRRLWRRMDGGNVFYTLAESE